MADAAQRFELATAQFQQLLRGGVDAHALDSSAENKEASAEKAEAVLGEQLKLLASTQSDSIYGKLANLYSAQAAINAKRFSAARAELAKFNPGQFAAVVKARSTVEAKSTDLLQELAALENGRLLIAEGERPLSEAQKQLKGLVLAGRFTNLEALLVLFRIGSAPEEHADAVRTANDLLTARPELRALISSQLSQNGISLE